jgi:hypothetical protein
MGDVGAGAAGLAEAQRPDTHVRGAQRRRLLDAGELAWIGSIPVAVLVVAAIVVLGPSLGELLFPRSNVTFWPSIMRIAPPDPEPTEHARFLIALTGPALLTGVILGGRRRLGPMPPAQIDLLVRVAQIVAFASVVLCVILQYRYMFSWPVSRHVVYFRVSTLVASGVTAAAIAGVLATDRLRSRFRWLFVESRTRRLAGTAVAIVAIVVWMLPAINFEDTIGGANQAIVDHIPYWLDEVYAALDGRFPLVDYAAQYGSLWPYPIAASMALLGDSLGVFTIAMSAIGSVAMLAMFDALRRVARSSLAALLLFLPFLATSFFMMQGPLENRYAIVNLFGTFPLRYAGPFLLVWVVTRHLDGASPRRSGWVFLAAGLVVLNNVDFGIPALGATVAALLWSRTRSGLPRLAIEGAVGLAGAVALVSVLTLVTAGQLPHLELLFRYSRLFALAGYAMIPMHPTLGVSTIIYLTYVAAISVATVRAVGDEADRVMTGLLAWSGVFGLGIGSYYMGRSHPEVLTNMFPAWALCIALLFVVAVRTAAARPPRFPSLAEVACLLGFGVLVCSLPQTPTPWSQVDRLNRTGDRLYAPPLGEPFIAAHIRPGESVAILTGLGHRAAYDLGVIDVTRYSAAGSMPTVDQFDETLADLRAAGGRKVFLAKNEQAWTQTDVPDALSQRGYRVAAQESYGMAEYVGP